MVNRATTTNSRRPQHQLLASRPPAGPHHPQPTYLYVPGCLCTPCSFSLCSGQSSIIGSQQWVEVPVVVHRQPRADVSNQAPHSHASGRTVESGELYANPSQHSSMHNTTPITGTLAIYIPCYSPSFMPAPPSTCTLMHMHIAWQLANTFHLVVSATCLIYTHKSCG